MLHEVQDDEIKKNLEAQANDSLKQPPSSTRDEEPYLALFTSHHLISPQKRRSMKQWSSSLHLHGFAKIGYPGVIYVEGAKCDVEEFVSSVKAMQWLNLRLRVIQSIGSKVEPGGSDSTRSWEEIEKMGDVVDEMKRRGGEEHLMELGMMDSA